jgi:hypothetical protein
MEALRVGRNDLCPCGSGKKHKVCCLRRQAVDQAFRPPPIERPRPVFGDGASTRPQPQPRLQNSNGMDRPIKRIPIHYTYPEPFSTAECVYCFPVELLIILGNGSVLRAEQLQPGMQFRMEGGILGTVTAVESPKVWEPPSRVPDQYGRYPRRVLGTIKHKGFVVVDITFGGQTVTGTPDHLWHSVSRKAWVPAQTLRRGELLLNGEGSVVAVEAVSEPRYGMIELYNLEVEELHTYFVGSSQHGSALVHNGTGNYIKKPITGMGNIGSHGPVSPSVALGSAERWLGQGYREIAPGVFRSADGLRQFRMTTRDLLPTHGNIGPHVHFEALDALGRVIENLHLPVLP